ncbi:hypothetical protein [Marinobacter confluentis]|uniref:Uncharacterized protein n=1 Tax=Marinobacter confluentis TaxID=1697557 RepID=A0A4Z1CIX9_9GAMM|nr:hypothetical protein [Marinobacter confluentis]TGN41192.1 hypothetical protein E5Q11_01165 [Marinobacter confluentis]
MEHVTDISAVEREPKYFDAVELAGLIVPLLLAILTIVMVSLNPDPSGSAAAESKAPSERAAEIHKR